MTGASNSRSFLPAKVRKRVAEAAREAREALEKEDKEWREAEGVKTRAARKREEAAKRRDEAAARKVEANRLAEQEQKDLEEGLRKSSRKVTAAELQRRVEEAKAAAREAIEEENRKVIGRVATASEYAKIVLVPNTNRPKMADDDDDDQAVVEASTIEEAIAQLKRVNCRR